MTSHMLSPLSGTPLASLASHPTYIEAACVGGLCCCLCVHCDGDSRVDAAGCEATASSDISAAAPWRPDIAEAGHFVEGAATSWSHQATSSGHKACLLEEDWVTVSWLPSAFITWQPILLQCKTQQSIVLEHGSIARVATRT